jgi:HSP20 family protein
MANFFEKLKKGMGVEEEKEEEKKIEKPKEKKQKKEEIKVQKVEEKKLEKKEYEGPEGELAIDLYQTDEDLVLQSAIAGVKSENLEIEIEGDMLTIRGVRERPFEEKGEYFTQECFWGPFSRKVILPIEVDADKAEAQIKNGVLTIRIKKVQKERKKKILVKE